MFCDMRSFTALADQRLPFDVVFLLNRYFAIVGEAVEKAGGRLDKFIGDGAMALFGLSAAARRGCRQAIAAARAILEGVRHLSDDLADESAARIDVAIGIHVGQTIVGTMGYGATMGVTAIGDAVNIGSRLEAAAKEFDADMVISEAAAKLSGLDFSALRLARDRDTRPRASARRFCAGARNSEYRQSVGDASGGPEQAAPPEANGSCLGRAHRVERYLVEFVVAAIHQADRHLFALPVDVDQAEELQPGRRRQILPLFGGRRLHEFELGSECHVQIAGPKCAGVYWARDELPERSEFLELGLLRVVVVRGRI